MRMISRTSRFRRDVKRLLTGQDRSSIQTDLPLLLQLLVTDTPLPDRYQDHALTGQWKGYRDCHLRPDLVLIYRKPDTDTLDLVRLGSHSELFKK